MKQSAMIAALSVVLCSAIWARADADERTFDLSPVAPPTPALKYELLIDPIDQQSGNAATYYQQAFAARTKDADSIVAKAQDAADHDPAAFESLAAAVYENNKKVFEILDTAARQDQCDWQTSFREKGFGATLPYLSDMQGIARLVAVHARQQVRHGKIDEALASLRLGYEIGHDATHDPVLVCGLVGVGIHALMNDVLAELMSHPQTPNLYWALASLPRPMVSFRHAMEGERFGVFATFPLLAKARLGELSADQWREVFKQIDQNTARWSGRGGGHRSAEQAALSLLPQARAHYAQTRHLSAGEIEKLDPLVVVGPYCLEQYQAVTDDSWKLTSLPYPILLSMLQQSQIPDKESNRLMNFVPSLRKAASMFARYDRQIAALTAVEAIRSYAAANGGRLPPTLQDITDTLVPENPYTGLAFEYTLDNDTATLSDPQPDDYPLKYTIRIRK